MNKSQNIYDNREFFDGYRKLRKNPDSANNIEEKPALFSLAPALAGKSVLDLGCGYGENCAEFLRMGASRVTGVDLSERMLNIATSEHDDIEFIRGDISDLSFIKGKYDVVFSSLALHYIEDFGKFAKEVYELMNHDGYFIFSQEHPLTTAPVSGASWSRSDNGNVLHYNLTDYTRSGKRSTTWIVDGVEKYHRTFSDIVNTLASAGFAIIKMIEPTPSEEIIRRNPRWAKELHKPNFLLIKVWRP